MAPRRNPLTISYGDLPYLPYGTPPADIAGDDFDSKVNAVMQSLPDNYQGDHESHAFAVIRNGDGHSIVREGNNCVYVDTGMETLDVDSAWDAGPLSSDFD